MTPYLRPLRGAAALGALTVVLFVLRDESIGHLSRATAALSLLFPAAIVACDIALISLNEQRPRHFVLGLAVPAGVVLLVIGLFLLLAPGWYGVPPIALLIRDRPWLASLVLVAIAARVILVFSAVRVHRQLDGAAHRRPWLAGLALSPMLLAVTVLLPLAVLR